MDLNMLEIRIPRELTARFAVAIAWNHSCDTQATFTLGAFLRFDRSLPCWLLHKRPIDAWKLGEK